MSLIDVEGAGISLVQYKYFSDKNKEQKTLSASAWTFINKEKPKTRSA